MIDFIHLYSKIDDHKTFLNDKFLKFIEGIEYLKQRTLSYFWHKDKDSKMLFKIGYNNWLDITGSLTKYQYGENYSNLTYSDLCTAIDDLANTVNKQPYELNLRSFEFGLNIHMFENLKAIELKDLAFNYKKSFFESIESNNKDPVSIGKRCRLQQYDIKIYNKSIEYDLPFDLLRIEIKVKRMKWVKHLEIKTLEDLRDIEKLDELKNILIETIEKTFFYDSTIDENLLTPNQRNNCIKWQSELFRKKLIKENPKKYEYQKKKMEIFIEKHGTLKIKENIINNINKEWNHFKKNN